MHFVFLVNKIIKKSLEQIQKNGLTRISEKYNKDTLFRGIENFTMKLRFKHVTFF